MATFEHSTRQIQYFFWIHLMYPILTKYNPDDTKITQLFMYLFVEVTHTLLVYSKHRSMS